MLKEPSSALTYSRSAEAEPPLTLPSGVIFGASLKASAQTAPLSSRSFRTS